MAEETNIQPKKIESVKKPAAKPQEAVKGYSKEMKIVILIIAIILLLSGGGFIGFKHLFVPYVADKYVEAYDEQVEDYETILNEMEEIDGRMKLSPDSTTEEIVEYEKDITRFLVLTKNLDKEIKEAEDGDDPPYVAGALDDSVKESDEFTEVLKETNAMYKEGYTFYQDLLPVIKIMAAVAEQEQPTLDPNDPTTIVTMIEGLQTIETNVGTASSTIDAIIVSNDSLQSYLDSLNTETTLFQTYIATSLESIQGLKKALESGSEETINAALASLESEEAQAAEVAFAQKMLEAEDNSNGIIMQILEGYKTQKSKLVAQTNKSKTERNNLVEDFDLDYDLSEMRK